MLPLKAALDAAGIPGWIDAQQMDGGDMLFGQIADGIDRADVVLLYLSPAYITRENCRKELSLAVDYGKRLLPILLPGTPWPLRPSHGAHAGEIAGHITGKVYISAQAEGGALVDKIVGALGKMGVGAAGGGSAGSDASGVSSGGGGGCEAAEGSSSDRGAGGGSCSGSSTSSSAAELPPLHAASLVSSGVSYAAMLGGGGSGSASASTASAQDAGPPAPGSSLFAAAPASDAPAPAAPAAAAPTAAAPALDSPASQMAWYYMDHNATVQGPFSSRDMAAWNKGDYFQPSLEIRLGSSGPFVQLAHAYPVLAEAFTRPYAVPGCAGVVEEVRGVAPPLWPSARAPRQAPSSASNYVDPIQSRLLAESLE